MSKTETTHKHREHTGGCHIEEVGGEVGEIGAWG